MNAPVPSAAEVAILAATAASRATTATGQADPAGARLAGLFALQKTAFAAEPSPALAVRRDRVARVLDLVTRHQDALVAAIDRDFGHRSAHETRLAELHIVASEARLALRMLPRWMRPKRVRTPLELLPGHGEIRRQPCGVIGIVSPWNYPVQLALAPAIGALAAGNRVLVKPSEITPATSALLAELIAAAFREDEFAVVQGDADTGRRFVAQRWDHLFFTGSTAVGRHVAQTAAANLVPVTLELGGKSPGAGRRRRRPRADRAETRRRQAAQCRPDLHRAGLRAGAGAAARCLRGGGPRRRRAAVPDDRRQSGLHVDRQRPPLRAPRRADRRRAREGRDHHFAAAGRRVVPTRRRGGCRRR